VRRTTPASGVGDDCFCAGVSDGVPPPRTSGGVGKTDYLRTDPAGVLATAFARSPAMKVLEIFHRVTVALSESGIAHMLPGSFASAYYGAPRTTQDIDFVIETTPAQLKRLAQLLPSDEYYFDLETALDAHSGCNGIRSTESK